MARPLPRSSARAVLTVIAVAVPVRNAAAIAELGDGLLTLDGSLRNSTLVTQNYDQPVLFADHESDGLSGLTLRLVGESRPADWLTAEVHGVQRLALSSLESQASTDDSAASLLGPGGGQLPYRIDDGSWHWADRDSFDARLEVDRLNVKVALPRTDITVGRQAITFGKAYFWNPLDVFLAFGANQFDRDYKPGADALRADVALGDFSGATLVVAQGNLDADDVWDESAVLARAFTNFEEWDLALQGGKIRGGTQVGGGLAGEIETLEIRAEGAGFFPMEGDPLPAHASAVLGVGRRFESTLHLQAEHLYNGGSAETIEESLALIQQGRLLHANRHVTGAVATYELHALVNGSMAVLFGWSDDSAILQPGLTCSAADEVDVVLGALIAMGKRPRGNTLADLDLRSEFGTYPNLYYVQAKIYF